MAIATPVESNKSNEAKTSEEELQMYFHHQITIYPAIGYTNIKVNEKDREYLSPGSIFIKDQVSRVLFPDSPSLLSCPLNM